MFLLFTPHPAPSSRLGCLPGQHLDMNPSFLSANHRSFSLIMSRHSDSLCGQLGCISLGAVHLMFKMFMPCLSCRQPGTVFNIIHKQVCTVRSHHYSAVLLYALITCQPYPCGRHWNNILCRDVFEFFLMGSHGCRHFNWCKMTRWYRPFSFTIFWPNNYMKYMKILTWIFSINVYMSQAD